MDRIPWQRIFARRLHEGAGASVFARHLRRMPAKFGQANFALVPTEPHRATMRKKLSYRDLHLPGASVCSFRQDHSQYAALVFGTRAFGIDVAAQSDHPPEAAEATLVVVVTLARLAFLPLRAAHDSRLSITSTGRFFGPSPGILPSTMTSSACFSTSTGDPSPGILQRFSYLSPAQASRTRKNCKRLVTGKMLSQIEMTGRTERHGPNIQGRGS